MTFNRILTSPIEVYSLYRDTRIYSQSGAEFLSLFLFIIQIYMVYVPWIYYTNRNIYLCEGTRRFILVHISRRTHSYSYSSYTVLNLYIYLDGGTCPHTHISIYLILIQISRRSYRAYAYTEVPLGTTKLTLMP